MFMLKTAALASALFLGFASTASATSISYTVDVGAGTLNGNNITSVAILESGGGQTSLSWLGSALNAVGATTFTHDVAFTPASTLIVGLDLAGGGNSTHLVFFTNNAFAQQSAGVLFSTVFPNTRHSLFINHLLAAEAGDATEEAWLLAFFGGDGAPAAFASGGPSTGIEFSPGTVMTPEPSSVVLLGLGLAAAEVVRRRRRVRTNLQ
jgi:hypothetical protein